MSGGALVLRRATPDDAEAIARVYMDSWNAGFEGFLPAREYTEELSLDGERTLTDPTRMSGGSRGSITSLSASPVCDRAATRTIRRSASWIRSPLLRPPGGWVSERS